MPPPDAGPGMPPPRLLRQDSRATFAAEPMDSTELESEADKARESRDLTDWMGSLEAKLDSLLELAKNPGAPPFSRQSSLRKRRVSLASGKSGKALSVISVDTTRTGPGRPWMQELLARGRRAVSEADKDKVSEAEKDKVVNNSPTSLDGRRRRSWRRRSEEEMPPMKKEDESLSPPSPGGLRRSRNASKTSAQQAPIGKIDKEALASKDQSPAPPPTAPNKESLAQELPSSSCGGLVSPSTSKPGFGAGFGKADSRGSRDSFSMRSSQETLQLPAEEQAQKVQERAAQLNSKLQKKLERNRTRAVGSQLSQEVTSTKPGAVKDAIRKVVTSPRFDTCVTLLIFANAFFIGVQVQTHAASSSSPTWYGHVEHACTGLFTLELFARMYVYRLEFFRSPREWSWNLFDTLLVFISWVDVCLIAISDNSLPESTAFISKLGRIVRIVRILRIIRTVRFFNQLRIMLKQLISSIQSLFWVFVILLAIIYAVAIIVTQSAADYLIIEAPPDSDLDTVLLRERFGTLFDTMYTLFQCISGGRSWGDASILMRGPGWVLEALVILYVFFSVYAVANIVNGIFVDGAIELAKRDRSHMIEKQRTENADKERHLVALLMAIDQDGDNTITYDEWQDALQRHEIRDYISALQVESIDAKALFTLLDADGSGNVNVGEFVSGMMTLRGEAKSIDVHMLLHENKRMISMMCGMMDFLYEKFDEDPTMSVEA